jgi:hypothetical protein
MTSEAKSVSFRNSSRSRPLKLSLLTVLGLAEVYRFSHALERIRLVLFSQISKIAKQNEIWSGSPGEWVMYAFDQQQARTAVVRWKVMGRQRERGHEREDGTQKRTLASRCEEFRLRPSAIMARCVFSPTPRSAQASEIVASRWRLPRSRATIRDRHGSRPYRPVRGAPPSGLSGCGP